jgi:hypothetical protein
MFGLVNSTEILNITYGYEKHKMFSELSTDILELPNM